MPSDLIRIFFFYVIVFPLSYPRKVVLSYSRTLVKSYPRKVVESLNNYFPVASFGGADALEFAFIFEFFDVTLYCLMVNA